MAQIQALYASCDFPQSSVACVEPAAVICPSLTRLVSLTSSLQVTVWCRQQRLTFYSNVLYLHIFSISDEATGKGFFQGPCEAHPITAAAHFTGLSPLCRVHPELPRYCPFNCYTRMFKCQSSQSINNQTVSHSTRDCFS